MKKSFWPIDLQRFAEGAAAGAEGAAGEGTAAVAEQDVFEGVDAQTKAHYKPIYDKIVADKKAAAPKVEEKPAEKPAQTRTPLKELLKDKEYQGEFQAIFNARFGEQKGLQDQLDKHQKTLESVNPVLDRLYARYNVKPGDTAALQEAMDNDEAYLESEAMKRGTTADMAKREIALERRQAAIDTESQRIKAEQEDIARRKQMAQTYQGWKDEGEKLKEKYQNFNFETEANSNPDFFKAVQMFQQYGFSNPVESALKHTYGDQLQQAVMLKTAEAAEEKTMNQVRSNLARPLENGVRPANANAAKINPSDLRPEQVSKLLEYASAHPDVEINASNMHLYIDK